MFELKLRQPTNPGASTGTFFKPAIQRMESSVTASASSAGCVPATGLPPTDCGAYAANSSWLPDAYVTNATCACTDTPDSPTANCVRKFLQDRLAATPADLKRDAYLAKKAKPITGEMIYNAFVQAYLTPRIYQDHEDAYSNCCCPCGPAPYWSWVGVTTVPIPACSIVGAAIRRFGSCHCTPGAW